MRRKKSPPLDPEIAELERQRDALQRDIRELQIEHDLLRTASELIKKDIGGDLQGLNNREKTMLIVALKTQYKAPELMARLGLPRSSYFYPAPVSRWRISIFRCAASWPISSKAITAVTAIAG